VRPCDTAFTFTGPRFERAAGGKLAVLMETSMLKATLLLLIAVEILGGQAFAADAASESGWIVGVGQHSCGTFLLALRAHAANGQGHSTDGTMFVANSELYQQWIWGYVSALSFRYRLKTTTDGAGITQWVAHWCESHGDESVSSAAGVFVAHLRNEK
jgi:hypothetical protein